MPEMTCHQCGANYCVQNYRVSKSRFCSIPCTLAFNRAERWKDGPADNTQRLARYQVRRGDDECWSWSGFKFRGYGRVSLPSGKAVGAHRIAYEQAFGPIPDGLDVLHRCDNRECTNPRHLWLGTHQDNNRDRDQKGRQAKGEGAGRTRITEAIVMEIRSSRASLVKLAARHGVSPSTVHHARVGRSWKHLPGGRLKEHS